MKEDEDEDEDNDMTNKDLNELPYYKAKELDKRNFFKILFSIFFVKMDLIHNIFFPDEYSSRLIVFSIYLISLYLYGVINELFTLQ